MEGSSSTIRHVRPMVRTPSSGSPTLEKCTENHTILARWLPPPLFCWSSLGALARRPGSRAPSQKGSPRRSTLSYGASHLDHHILTVKMKGFILEPDIA